NVVVRTERIEVLIPEAVTFDDEADAQLRAGAHAVKEAVPSLPHAPVEALLAWAALRDGLAGGDASAEEVRSLLDAVAAAFPHNQGIARAAEAARRRWNLRPLNVFSVKP